MNFPFFMGLFPRSIAVLLLVLLLPACVIVNRIMGPSAVVPDPLIPLVFAAEDPLRPERIVLTWADDPATTQSVTWRTGATVETPYAQIALAKASPLFVYHARTVPAESEVVPVDTGLVQAHSVTFTELEPKTLYAYRVGDGTQWSEWFQFRTASDAPEPFSFIYMGDAQNDLLSLWSRTIRAAYTRASTARFMIHAGDLIDRANSDSEWGEWFEAGGWIHGMRPSIPAVGNHEYAPDATGKRTLSSLWNPHFTLPRNGPEDGPDVFTETVYSFDYQGVRFIVLNTMEDPEAQTAWLDSVLTDNPNRWTVAVYHHPMYSAARGRNNPKLREQWQPLFDRYGVDLALQGHDHTYARGGNIPSGRTVRDDEAGTVFVVSVSGPKMYRMRDRAWMDRIAENTQLYQIISIDADTLRYEAYTVVDDLYDAFDLVKQPDGQPNLLINHIPDTRDRRFGNTTSQISQE